MELKGSLRNFPLPDIIQLIGMGRRTGVLAVTMQSGDKASIFFDSGQMTHAEYGSVEGAQVIYKLFRNQDGSFQFASGVESSKRSIQADWMTIVMEAARRFDEEEYTGAPAHGDDPLEMGNTVATDYQETKRKMRETLDRHFGKKAKKIQDELEKVGADPDKLTEFCNKIEKYIFVFIDNQKAKDVADELRKIVRVDQFG
jgi:hypothetical protein